MIEGLDLSGNNPLPTPDGVQQAWDSGRRFMIPKIGEGTWFDPSMPKFVSLFAPKGFICDIGYHFARPKTDPVQCAKIAARAMKDMGFESPTIALDCESDDRDWPHKGDLPVPHSILLPWYKAFIRTALDELAPTKGPGVILYSMPGFWNPLQADQEWLKVPSWVAHWTRAAVPMNMHPWDQSWTFWQWAAEDPSGNNVGQVPGLPGIVDCDRFAGTFEQLQAFLGQTPGAPESPMPRLSQPPSGAKTALAIAGTTALAVGAGALIARATGIWR
ncbi:MAG: GH25 family lysozyme [Candidatus Cryosericum sp.]